MKKSIKVQIEKEQSEALQDQRNKFIFPKDYKKRLCINMMDQTEERSSAHKFMIK